MKPVPPLLTAACVLFWGLQANLLLFAVPLAVALEAPRWIQARFALRTAPLARTFDFCLLGSMVLAGYLITTGSPTQGIALALQWLPMMLAPFVLGQGWRETDGIDLKALWSVRQRREPPPARPYTIDFRWLYLPICLVAASAANQRGMLFFATLALLGAWALLAARDRSRPLLLWAVLVAVATGLGYAGQLGLHRLQGVLFELAFSFDPSDTWSTDPYRSHTALGHIGTLKFSDAIELRVRPAPGQDVPGLLHRATYDRFGVATWFAKEAPLEPLATPRENGRWRLEPDLTTDQRVTIETRLEGQRTVLAVPEGTTSLDGLIAKGMSRNRFGVLEVAPGEAGLVDFTASYRPGFAPPSAAPTPADIEVPDRLRPLLDRYRTTLGLGELSPAEVARRVERWFGTEFGYSLYQEGDPMGRDALEAFLDTTRAGHCEYFATATVLLLRAAGIPARYVTGYAVTEWSGFEQAYLVRRRHAHAWTSAFVDGQWLTLDTTPSTWAATEQAEASPWQPFADAWNWLSYRYQRWRQQSADDALSPAWLLVLLPPLVLLGWRLRRTLRRPGDTAAADEGDLAATTAGADSPFYRLEQALGQRVASREIGESPERWATRLGERLADAELDRRLAGIVRLHYGYRFDPAGESAALRRELEAEVNAWLVSFDRTGRTAS
jgi:transglutaminase-like putative cysteine protease